jgi:hypothetical protein
MGSGPGYAPLSTTNPTQHYDDEAQVCWDPSSGRGNSFLQDQLSCSEDVDQQQDELLWCPSSSELDQSFSTTAAGSIPPQLIPGIIHYEAEDRDLLEGFGESWKISREDWTVSLGGGDIQVRRAAELLHPGRDWDSQPLTSEEFTEIVELLQTHEGTVKVLTMSLEADYAFYGRNPGKSEEDRWKFALAKHKGGHRVVGSAQQAVIDAGGDSNLWSEVSQRMDGEVVSFVENVWAFSP